MIYNVYEVLTGLYFWSNILVVCGQHRRGIPLQPFTRYDAEAGYGYDQKCPFCPAGSLHGTYHLYRSKKALERILDTLQERRERGLNDISFKNIGLLNKWVHMAKNNMVVLENTTKGDVTITFDNTSFRLYNSHNTLLVLGANTHVINYLKNIATDETVQK